MKKQALFTILLSALLIVGMACEDWTTSIDPLIDNVEDDRLTAEPQISFVINGVHTKFATTHDVACVLVGLLADEMYFDPNVPNATFPSFSELDLGEILIDNSSVGGNFLEVGEMRFFADDLTRRVGEIEFSDQDLRNEAMFWSKFYGGAARYFYATYWGLNPTEGGGVIDNGPFIPSADMYDLALDFFTEALQYTEDAYLTRLIHSCMARIFLFENDFTNAATHANQGLEEGDDPFQSLHSVQSDNYFWQQAGVGRTQCLIADRFEEYVEEDPLEANRIPIDYIEDNNGLMRPRQGKYMNETIPINFISWQENSLMLAECALEGQAGDALTLVNAVRASHGLDALDAVDIDVLKVERDKELCWTGIRLADQRRWGDWHLGAGTWQYMPITERERNINPYID